MKKYMKPETNILMISMNTNMLAGSETVSSTSLEGTSYGGNASESTVPVTNADSRENGNEWNDEQ